jgi:hypothetical protein
VRRRHWPLTARHVIKGAFRKYIRRDRTNPKGTSYLMGQVFSARAQLRVPCFATGGDYAGPLYLKERFRSQTTSNAYWFPFVFLSTEALHSTIWVWVGQCINTFGDVDNTTIYTSSSSGTSGEPLFQSILTSELWWWSRTITFLRYLENSTESPRCIQQGWRHQSRLNKNRTWGCETAGDKNLQSASGQRRSSNHGLVTKAGSIWIETCQADNLWITEKISNSLCSIYNYCN